MDKSFRPSGFTPALGRVEAAARRFFDARAKARAYLRSNGKDEIQGLRFAQNDGVEETTARATATTEADPYGDDKKGKQRQQQKRG